MRRLAVWLGLVVAVTGILIGCGRKLSAEQSRELLAEVRQARQAATLQGKMAISVRVRDEVMRAEADLKRAPGIVHLEYDSGEFARWKIVEQDGKVWRVGPDGKAQSWEYGVPGGGDLPRRPNLRVVQLGGGQVAGREVERYRVQAPGGGRSRVEIAVDRATRYPLRLSRYDARGQLVSESVFETVDYAAAAPKPLPVPKVAQERRRGPGGPQAASEVELAEALGGPLLRPGYVPAGFQLRGTFQHGGQRRTMAELRYSDGLRTLSVMQSRAPEPGERGKRGPGLGPGQRPGGGPGPGGERRQEWGKRGPRPGGEGGPGPGGRGMSRSEWRGHVVRERRGDRMVVVAGDVPPEELRRVMDSVR